MARARTFRFTITADVDEAHEAYDDPEWAADAAAGALANIYGIRCIYTDIADITDTRRDALLGSRGVGAPRGSRNAARGQHVTTRREDASGSRVLVEYVVSVVAEVDLDAAAVLSVHVDDEDVDGPIAIRASEDAPTFARERAIAIAEASTWPAWKVGF